MLRSFFGKPKTQIAPITARTRDLLNMSTIESQFPIEFDNGSGFPMFTAFCGQCNHPIESEHLRGIVTRSRKDQYTVEAAGACFACNIATPVNYRLHEDGTMTGISPYTGKWTEWNRRPGLMRDFLHTLFPGRF